MKNFLENITVVMNTVAMVIGYVIIVTLVSFILCALIAYLRQQKKLEKYRLNEIEIPFSEFQEEKLGEIDPDRKALFIIINNMDINTIYNIYNDFIYDEQWSGYDLFAVLLQNNITDEKSMYRCISEIIYSYTVNRIRFKRILFSIPNGVNVHLGTYIIKNNGIELEKEFIYYTLNLKGEK